MLLAIVHRPLSLPHVLLLLLLHVLVQQVLLLLLEPGGSHHHRQVTDGERLVRGGGGGDRVTGEGREDHGRQSMLVTVGRDVWALQGCGAYCALRLRSSICLSRMTLLSMSAFLLASTLARSSRRPCSMSARHLATCHHTDDRMRPRPRSGVALRFHMNHTANLYIKSIPQPPCSNQEASPPP